VDGHVVVDAGNCGAAALHRLIVPSGTLVTVALGMGGMGYSLPAAVGAQLGRSGGRTLALCGDGSFLMNGFEVHTAVDLRLPILYVVFNNNMHGTCVSRQHLMFESRVECSRFGPVDVAAVARGLGAAENLWVGSAGTLTELAEALGDYHERYTDRPGVLELRIAHPEVPPITPFTPADTRAPEGAPNEQQATGHAGEPESTAAGRHALRAGHTGHLA
jgi:acetolactate synthase-1/2/3 large subunit